MNDPKINWGLKKAIRDAGFTQRELGALSGVHESFISLASNGRYVLTPVQRKKILRILKVPEEQLFS